MKAITLMLLVASAAMAQDQTVNIEASPKVIVAPACADKKDPPCDPLTAAAAPDLIEQALGHKQDPATKHVQDTKRSYLIHVAIPDEKKTEFKKEAWYTYEDRVQHPGFFQKASDPFTNWFKEKRVFGSPDASLVYLYWVRASKDRCAVLSLVRDALKRDAVLQAQTGDPTKFKTDEADTCKLPVAAAYLDRHTAELGGNLIKKLFDGDTTVATENFILLDRASGATIVKVDKGPLQGYAATEHTRDVIGAISYKIAISKKIPTPLANLRDIIGMVFPAQEAPRPVAIDLPYAALAGGQDFQVNYLPSDMVVSTIATETTDDGSKQQKELSKNTWDNERRYPIDFSLALPLVSYKDATVDVNNGNITAKEVKKEKLVAMFDFSPWWLINRDAGFETKKIAMQLLPVIEIGIPIAGKPLQHPILAAGIGVSKAHFFFGTQFNRKSLPAAPASGGADSSTITLPPGPVTQRWGTQFVWGIDFSVRMVTDLLKKKQ